MVATLPVEVEERIIDKLHYHVDALQNCALTCRRWRPRTRYHLFAAIRVTTKDELLLLYALLSQSPHLLPLVRSLTIRAELDNPEVAQLFQMVPVPLFTSLSNLVYWKFCGTRTGRDSRGEWDYTSAPAYHRTGLATIRRLRDALQKSETTRMPVVTKRK
ncbi:hypothetical protein C8Q74DRAFT_1209427 [Fomes fomentarius]|nr:hypothetical protein C8Q74DRAFT_1209427 [Fomes fomentarius]